ncbi:serine/threonine-protein kinase [Catenulispora sp. EB89]|uniref:serine/threonine-protein kinase n=1 Tax=Catenulispora sp. EB89 TaxID=3156257 RepID=UPI0035126DFF
MRRLLGTGGMGRVWLAHDERSGIDVALKEVRLDTVTGQTDRKSHLSRAWLEALHALSVAKSSNIVEILDVFEEDGRPWIVMELVIGKTLAQAVAQHGPLPPVHVAHIGKRVLMALTACHVKDIVHRDVKPSNILLADDGRVLLTDFGIAAGGSHYDITMGTLTPNGIAVGTPEYMAPERMRGRPATAASDLFSLGATLYFAVEGHSPFRRDSFVTSSAAVLFEPVGELRRGPVFKQLLSGLMEKDPSDRTQTADAYDKLTRIIDYNGAIPFDGAVPAVRAVPPTSGPVATTHPARLRRAPNDATVAVRVGPAGAKKKGPGQGHVKLVWDPAGHDRKLATITQELRAGRYTLAAELLADRQVPEDVRDYRYLILAQIAASNGVDTAWLAEEPAGPEAALLRLRANVIRALQAHRGNHPRAEELIQLAGAQCLETAERFPEDPLPWIALLHLAPAAPDNVLGPPELRINGPWRTMAELWQRDPWNREAHHRLLTAVGPKCGGSASSVSGVAHWIAGHAPARSALLVLPLVALVEAFRQQLGPDNLNQTLLTHRNWSTAYAEQETERCYLEWFAPNGGHGALLPDLHHLAHALWAGLQWLPATHVFDAIGPYALTTPWSLHGNPERVLLTSRERSMTEL